EVGRDGASETQRLVRVTQPFYIGVYQVTQQQWGNVTVSPRIRPSFFNNELDRAERPVEMVSYFEVRENVGNSDNPAIDWPATGHTVAEDSFIGRLRAKTGGVIPFDLPTDAQWEYAGRAGTLGAWNNGTTAVSDIADPNLDLLGRYSRNGGQLQTGPSAWSNPPQDCLATNGTAKVGSYLPNDWGLYDMHGNVLEWCLDWYAASLAAFDGDDPEGPATSSNASRVTHGGAWIFTASYGRSAKRNSNGPSTQVNHIGFRVAAPAAVNVSL
ncbi:MAG: formylglycine-generating enzyme family protein, partial [Verrucomicrobiota bacterium]|nr:formylglycine-generating enzyme family protein [Verrucomicrobiota bacterium]